MTEPLQVRIDPRSRTSADALKARFDASQNLAELARAFAEGARAVEGLDREVAAIQTAVKGSANVPSALSEHLAALAKQVETLKGQFRAGFGGPKFQILDLAGQLQASTTAPTDAQRTTIDHLAAQLTERLTTLNTTIARELPQLESELKANNINRAGLKTVELPKIR